GHQIVFIVGDFTGVIGDTSDKDSERPMLSEETIAENMKNYVEQAGKIIDITKAEVHSNSEWLGKLTYSEIGRQADAFSLSEFTSRENIKKRLDEGKRVSLRELLYPLMQGYDSVAIQADVELGGTDQRFNLLAGRHLQPLYDQKPQDILMGNLILGTDGRKMSSSWGNTINLLDSPNDMFGKVMSIPDELIVTYLVHCTRVPMEDVEKVEQEMKGGANPKNSKVFLAKMLVSMYHDEGAAEEAEKHFQNVFSEKGVPEEIIERRSMAGEEIIDIIVELEFAGSKGEARRLIEQGGVELNQEKVTDVKRALLPTENEAILKVGKRNFARILIP
ncbi:MAG: tyrosine--tRNA ligase, partial [Patescibacteria group bacterium]